MKMVSPFLLNPSSDTLKIDKNAGLGQKLREFFEQPTNDHLWQLSTHRQKITYALRHTESIHLRYLKDLPKDSTTLQANQHMAISWASTSEIPVIKQAIDWFDLALRSTGAENVEFGRIFVSKLSPKSTVDLHTDEGRYFSYYDRFHYTITAAAENTFTIQGKDYILETDSLYWVNNHVPHWLANNSDCDRINFILDARLS
jgi:quercetin dioxygenase-like cupin family protein